MKPFFIVMGRSASGKSTLVAKLVNALNLIKCQTMTTRPRREGEPEGDYIFRTEEEFMKTPLMECINYDNTWYGTPAGAAETADIHILNVEGAQQIQKYMKSINRPCYVIGLSCSKDTAGHRMLARGDAFDKVQRRLDVDDEAFAPVQGMADLYIENFELFEDYATVLEFMLNCYRKEVQ